MAKLEFSLSHYLLLNMITSPYAAFFFSTQLTLTMTFQNGEYTRNKKEGSCIFP